MWGQPPGSSGRAPGKRGSGFRRAAGRPAAERGGIAVGRGLPVEQGRCSGGSSCTCWCWSRGPVTFPRGALHLAVTAAPKKVPLLRTGLPGPVQECPKDKAQGDAWACDNLNAKKKEKRTEKYRKQGAAALLACRFARPQTYVRVRGGQKCCCRLLLERLQLCCQLRVLVHARLLQWIAWGGEEMGRLHRVDLPLLPVFLCFP